MNISDCHTERNGKKMFNFRIINLPDGNQIIDPSLKTPYNALTSLQMVEYQEIDVQLTIADRLKKKAQAESERRRKLVKNPLYRFACLCGIV